MSRGKTVIDIYVGMRNEDGDIIAREKSHINIQILKKIIFTI
ncbi:hypothetical protein [Nosocomiicoccus massiliensis]|nr:hypothetical protein [Nosocomiicoccus massiliensis]